MVEITTHLRVHVTLLLIPQEGWESGSDAVLKMFLCTAVCGTCAKSIQVLSARRGMLSWKIAGLPLLHLKRSLSATA